MKETLVEGPVKYSQYESDRSRTIGFLSDNCRIYGSPFKLPAGRIARLVIAGLFAVTVTGCTDDTATSPDRIPEAEPTREEAAIPAPDADLVVIGAGLAGLSAALEASAGGRSVLVVDMASVFGGHAVMSAGGMAIVDTPMQREQDIVDTPDIAYADFVNWGEDINEVWARYYVDNSREMIYDWATTLGVEFNLILQPPGNSVPRMHFPKGLGLGLIAPIMRQAVARPGIDFRWNTRVDTLITRDGRVVGISTTNTRTGAATEYYGNAVVIATGGYQSNLARVRENWRDDLPKPGILLAGSGWNSRGSGLDLASGAGGALEHLEYTWNYVTGVPDPRYDNNERGLRFFVENGAAGTEIWLNDSGERFINECLSPKYALGIVLEQPGKSHWMLFDARLRPQASVAGTGWTPERVERLVFQNPEIVKSANTLTELAGQMSIAEEKLTAAVARFNGFIDAGQDQDFLRFGSEMDPRGGGCRPAARLDQPPFYAVKRYPLTRKSMGGIKIDSGSRVLDLAGSIIPGLYAAGEATGLAGINGKAGLEGTFLGPSLVTGRVAGRSVLVELTDMAVVPVSRDIFTTSAPDEPAPGNEECTACHNISALTGVSRPGYQHFELAHELVLEREQPCADCHNGMLPFEAARHRIRMANLVDTCDNCHGSGGD